LQPEAVQHFVAERGHAIAAHERVPAAETSIADASNFAVTSRPDLR
jgi:hypothetical protein